MKRKPSQVVVHRIEFQDSERQMLSDLTSAYMGSKIVYPFVEIIKDVSAMASLTTMYLAFRYGEDVIDQMKEHYEDVQEVVIDGLRIAKNSKEMGLGIVRDIPIMPGGTIGTVMNAFDVLFG